MSRQNHFWIVAVQDSRPVLIYGSTDERLSRQKGLEMLPGIDFQIKRLPTSNLQRASSLLRGSRLDETHDLREATKRQMHERGLKRRLDNNNRGYPI